MMTTKCTNTKPKMTEVHNDNRMEKAKVFAEHEREDEVEPYKELNKLESTVLYVLRLQVQFN